MIEKRIRVAPNTIAYADKENHKLVMEFAIQERQRIPLI